MAAGAIGSTEILLKSINTTRNTGQKLNLSNKLGSGYSTNGDLLGVIHPTKTTIYAIRQLLGFVGLGSIQQIISMITQNPLPIPVSNTSLPVQISEQDLTNVLLLSGMGTDTSDGTIKLQDLWKNDPNRDMNTLNVLDVGFDLNKLAPLFTKRIQVMLMEVQLLSFTTWVGAPWEKTEIME